MLTAPGPSTSADEEQKRLERNRKQREYRARRRAEETQEQKDERNNKQREYRARRKAESSTITYGDFSQSTSIGSISIPPTTG